MYDKAFVAYPQPFVKDAYIAAQIAYKAGDTGRVLKYFRIAFQNDFPLSAIVAAPMFRDLSQKNPTLYQKLKESYGQFKGTLQIDKSKQEEIFMMGYVNDSLHEAQPKTEAVIHAFAEHEAAFRKFILDNYLNHGIFPSERILGIRTEEDVLQFYKEYRLSDPYAAGRAFFSKLGKQEMSLSGVKTAKITFTAPLEDKVEWSLFNQTALTPFIHYTCTWELYKELLWKAVLNGYLHPKEYGMLQEMSFSWNHERKLSINECEYKRQDAYFNILGKDVFRPTRNTYVTDSASLVKVEENRAENLMQRFDIDQKKRGLEKSEGFLFFYGFSRMR
ncbi:MAG: hypothetical protein ABI378_04685 [Chitinophagaceae bacterium]